MYCCVGVTPHANGTYSRKLPSLAMQGGLPYASLGAIQPSQGRVETPSMEQVSDAAVEDCSVVAGGVADAVADEESTRSNMLTSSLVKWCTHRPFSQTNCVRRSIDVPSAALMVTPTL